MAVTKSPSAIEARARSRSVHASASSASPKGFAIASATLRIRRAFSASSRDPETASARTSIDATWMVSRSVSVEQHPSSVATVSSKTPSKTETTSRCVGREYGEASSPQRVSAQAKFVRSTRDSRASASGSAGSASEALDASNADKARRRVSRNPAASSLPSRSVSKRSRTATFCAKRAASRECNEFPPTRASSSRSPTHRRASA